MAEYELEGIDRDDALALAISRMGSKILAQASSQSLGKIYLFDLESLKHAYQPFMRLSIMIF